MILRFGERRLTRIEIRREHSRDLVLPERLRFDPTVLDSLLDLLERCWGRESIELGLDSTGNPDLAELASEKIQPANDSKVRNRRGITRYEHRRRLAPTPRRRNAVQSLAVPPSRRRAFDSSPRVRRLCRAKALLEHRARWRVRSGVTAQSPPRECGGLGGRPKAIGGPEWVWDMKVAGWPIPNEYAVIRA